MNRPQRLGLLVIFVGVCVVALLTQRLLDARRLNARPAELYEVVRQTIEACVNPIFRAPTSRSRLVSGEVQYRGLHGSGAS
jgi:hypothetical protein